MANSSTRSRVGLIYLSLTGGAMITALVLSAHFHLGVVQTALTLIPSVPGLFLAWAAFRFQSDHELTMAEKADQLALTVTRQWEAEAALRRLNDPHPLPVAWKMADSNLVEQWPVLVDMAAEWQADSTSSRTEWVSGPEKLAGSGSELADVLTRRIPTARLVVLGKPGAGKTLLLVRLMLTLLARRKTGDPVPVLVPMAAWDPGKLDLHSWLVSRLASDYPGLGGSISSGSDTSSQLRALLSDRKLALILDGIDEIPERLRGRAIARINDALRPGEGIVLSCRAEQYEQAADPSNDRPIRLRGAAGIELRNLDSADVEAYLRKDAITAQDAARWNPVFAALRTGGPLTQALSTPLMVGLARTIYNPRPGERAATIPDPTELCEAQIFSTAESIESHLFDAFIPASYRPHPDPERRCPWPADKAEHWLIYLSGHLANNRENTTDLAWWELHYAVPRPLIGVVTGLACGLPIGVAAWLGPHLGIGIGIGLMTSLIVGILVRTRGGRSGGEVSGVPGGIVTGILGGFVGGIIVGRPTVGLVGGLGLGVATGSVSGLAGGIVGCFIGGVALGLTAGHFPGIIAALVDGLGAFLAAGLAAEFAGRSEPARGLRSMHWTPSGLGVGVACGLGGGITASLTAGPVLGISAGLAVGFSAALGLGLQGAPLDSETAAAPRTSLANDRRTFLAIGCAAGITVGLGGALGAVWIGVGMAGAFAVGLGVSFQQAAWWHFLITTSWLAARRKLPWRLMSFLADAHEKRGVLRLTGAVYQFRHAELQRRLSMRS